MGYAHLIDASDAEKAYKAVEYYEGESKDYLMKFLQNHRVNALKKGLMPRTRNITKMIVDKSAPLFTGKAPKIEVYASPSATSADEIASAKTQILLESANWVEFFKTLSAQLRLLKTMYVLVQYSPEKQRLLLTGTGRHNSAVAADEFGDLTVYMYKLYERGNDGCVWRVITPEFIQEVLISRDLKSEEVLRTEPNPYGIIFAVPFHDTELPFNNEAWNDQPMDLIDLNDIVNIHYCDSEFAAMWNKNPTLFTNARVQSESAEGQVYDFVQAIGEPLPRMVRSTSPGVVGGPGSIVAIDAGGESVYLEYKNPSVDLLPMDNIISKWVADFAGDYSVNIKLDGNGSAAESGFKLIVEEMPNLELRKERQRMMEAGFKKLYEVLKVIANFHGIGLPVESQLWVSFAPPELPLDEAADEALWTQRISQGRASRIDYFMVKMGLSRDEAIQKVQEVDADNASFSLQVSASATPTA